MSTSPITQWHEPAARSLRLVLPREHGVWAMWIVPVALGAWLSGPNRLHFLLFLGAGAVHLATFAALEAVRHRPIDRFYLRWATGYGVVAAALLVYPVWRHPLLLATGAAAALLLGINVLFARWRLERLLVNDMAAIAGLQLWGPAAYLVGSGVWNLEAWRLWALTWLFFAGTALHVKTLFRERGRLAYKLLDNGVHLLLPPAGALLVTDAMVWALVPAVVRSWLTPFNTRLRPLTAGIIEIANAAVFLTLVMWLWPPGP